MSSAYLILCHKPPKHLALWARRYRGARYYVHYDAKSPLEDLHFLQDLDNVMILPQRVNVRWAGFSMVEASLHLFQAALNEPQNRYLHFISGDCAPLCCPEKIAQECAMLPENTLWLQMTEMPRLRYRTRFDAPHADTDWQRSWLGKALTQGLKWTDRLLPSSEICLSGSQWFSATRAATEILLAAYDKQVHDFFRKKLCPDEHFFQYLAQEQAGKLHLIKDNRRFIRFQVGQNHPDTLSLADVQAAQQAGFWFARKVAQNDLLTFVQQTENRQ